MKGCNESRNLLIAGDKELTIVMECDGKVAFNKKLKVQSLIAIGN